MARVPSAKAIGAIPMPGRQVRFHKKSKKDLSAKCNLVESSESAIAYGVLYELSAAEKARLDAVEGLGFGYKEALAGLSLNGVSYRPFVYVAETSYIDPSLHPYHWYKDLVLAGARYHGLPYHYVAELASVRSIPDPDPARRAENEALLAKMAEF